MAYDVSLEARVIAQGLLVQAIRAKQAGARESLKDIFHAMFIERNMALRIHPVNEELTNALLLAYQELAKNLSA